VSYGRDFFVSVIIRTVMTGDLRLSSSCRPLYMTDVCLICTQIISFAFCFIPDNFIAFHLLLGYGLHECAK
jgi:hypothetical protein